jgi:hypothetical protein
VLERIRRRQVAVFDGIAPEPAEERGSTIQGFAHLSHLASLIARP